MSRRHARGIDCLEWFKIAEEDFMRRRHGSDLRESDVTPEAIYRDRRRLMKVAAGAALAAGAAGLGARLLASRRTGEEAAGAGPVAPADAAVSPEERRLTAWADATGYNNFYEFGPSKSDPGRYAGRMTIRPWHVRIDGLVDHPGEYPLEEVLRGMTIERRIYRFR
ncbi:MAG TPA: hypothetical protein ENK13_05725, partial [Thermopetrobacter sp.]|nr:hypothetical protein [Thermopetrobacter sp.]